MEFVCSWKRSDCKEECQAESETDPQKERLYCWEEHLHDQYDIVENSIDLSTCEQMVYQICEQYGIWSPEVKDGRGLQFASADGERIHLPRWFRDKLSTVHEACHVVAGYFASSEPAHGPAFVRLLTRHFPQFIPEAVRSDLIESSKLFGLRLGPRFQCKKASQSYRNKLRMQREVANRYKVEVDDVHKVLQSLVSKAQHEHKRYLMLAGEIHDSCWPD